jgi:hypothetical protein
VVLAFRGASNIAGLDNGNPPDDITTNALNLDFYGDKAGPGTPTFLSGTDWKADITSINTAQYFQVRISFISNTSTDQTAELRSLAFAYRQL